MKKTLLNQWKCHFWLAAILPGMGLVVAAPAQQTDNYELRAVPVPGKVIMDGKLNDWDLSGEIMMCYDLGALLQTHSVRAAAMYDATNLYLAFRFKDATPMVNHVDPKTHPGEGWKSDCVQLRIRTDDPVPIHVDAYYFTDEQRPTMIVQYTDCRNPAEKVIAEALNAGAAMAFLKDPDGKGYTQELSVPWKLLRAKGEAYRPGESFRLGFECFWGDATGSRWYEMRLTDLLDEKLHQREFFWTNPDAWGTVKLMPPGNLAPSESVKLLSKLDELRRLRFSTRGPAPISYKIPFESSVTLVIEKSDGTRVRNLIANYPRPAGKNVDYWDGADDSGRLVPPGEYRVRGLYHGDLDALFQFNYGFTGNPPWYSSDAANKGKWLSDHCAPMAVLADDQRIYIASPFSEDGHVLVATDYNGVKQWGRHGFGEQGGGGFMALYGGFVYVVHDIGGTFYNMGWGDKVDAPAKIILHRLDPATGKAVAFPDGKAVHTLAEWAPFKEGFTRDNDGATIANHAHNADWCNIQAQGIAAIGSNLFVSMHFAGKLLKIDAEKGEVVGEIPLPRPAGLASDGSRLFAISAKQIVEVGIQTGQVSPVVTSGLSAPIGLALDKSGNFYVSDWADQMCVKVFTPEGKPLRTIGKVGGRPWMGRYDPQGMLLPRGISVDSRGRVWVAEDDYSPKRISCWNPDGTLALEKIGPPWYAAAGLYIFPDQPDRGIMLGNLMELDWKTGQWRVISTLWRPLYPDALLGFTAEPSSVDRVVKHRGRTLLVHSANNGILVISELKDDVAIPLAAVGTCASALESWQVSTGRSKGGARPPLIFADHLWSDQRTNDEMHKVIPWFFDSPRAGALFDVIRARWTIQAPHRKEQSNVWYNPDNNFIWCDTNGNGRVEPEEVTYFATPGVTGLVSGWRTSGWTHSSGPDLTLYLDAQAEPTNPQKDAYFFALPVSGWAASGAPIYDPKKASLLVRDQPALMYNGLAWVSKEGSLLAIYDPMTMYRPDGRIAWTYPNHWPGVHPSHKAPKAENGLLIGPLKVLGSIELGRGVGEVFGIIGNLGRFFLCTTDGLYVAEMFRDCRSAPEVLPDEPRRGMSIKETTLGAEPFGGEFFRNAKDGNIYLLTPQGNVTQITGLESVRRLPTGKLAFTPAQYSQAEELLKQQALEAAKSKSVQIVPPAQPPQGAPDAGIFRWTAANSAAWQFDGRHAAEAAWTFDNTNLYLCFHNILDDTPMINGGKDPSTLMKTGDAAIFELRTAANTEDAGVIPGDLRLLFSVYNGKPVAVLYRYKVSGVKEPVSFTSGVGVTKIDLVKVIPTAQVAVDRQGDRYTLRATVPLSELEFKPESGKTYRGDFGIVYSDRAGRVNELRMYWSNPVTAMVSDLSIEAGITPGVWGRFVVPAKEPAK